MSDESDIESLHSLTNRKKRKPRIVDDSDSSDSDSSIDNVSRRKRVFKVNSDEESDSSDSEPVPVRPKNKTLRVVSDESLGSDNSSWESDSSSNSETEAPSTSQPGPSSAAIINNAALLSDSSDGQSDKCPICLISFSNQEIGTPEVCDHDFCAECIQEWSRNVNTCPVDRQEFSLILVRRRLNGKVVRRVPVEKRRPEGEENIDLDPTFCEVCGQSDREDRMLLCDSCDLGYHLECLDPPLESVPIDEWYCSDCRGGDTYGLEETYENSSRTTRRRITPSSVPRLVPRTRQAERVRANIVNQRVERETVNRSGVDFDQPSTSSGFESSNIGTVHRSSQTTLRRRATTTTVSKRKKRKRRAKRRNRTKTVEYEIDEESGKKFALKKKVIKRRKKRKTRRKKLREKRVIVPKTVKKRLASQLGICPLKNAKQMIPDVKNNTHSNGIAFQRYQAGIPTLNLFGNRDDLDYFSDSDDDMLAGDGGVVSLASRSRHYLMSAGNHARLKNISIQSPPCASTACDILSGILDSQSKLHSKNSVLSLDRDGTVLVEDLSIKNKIPETNETPNTPDSNDLELGNSKIDINDNNAINDRVTQNPMYPGYGGGGGNRPPYNFGRGSSGGYRGNYNSGGNYGNGSMFNSRGRGTGGFDPRDGRAMYTDYLHRGPSPAHRGIPPFQRGRGAPRFPRRPPNQGMEFNYRDPDEREIDLSMSVQENQVSRSTEPHPDTSGGHTQPQQNERFEEDEFDIYSDIETSASRDDPEPVGVNEAVPVLAPPPVPPMLPGIIYGSDSEENNSDTELVIDDAVKADAVYDSEENNSVAVCTVGDAVKAEGDEYDPAKPSGDTDSEPDTTNAANLNSDSAVASTSNAFDNSISDNSIIGPQLPEEVRISQEEEDNVENVAVVQPRIVILQQENVDTNNEGECPNFSVYAKDTENIENEERVNQQSDDDSKDDCPNFSIYSAESMDIAKTTEQALPISLDVTSGGDLEPDSVQNAEVESSTKDFDIAPQHADVSNSDELDSIENEPDSNNMEKDNVNKDEDDGPSSPSLPQVLLTETENQSEEISTTQNDVDYESKTGKNEELKPNEQPSSTIRKKIDIMFKPNMQRVLQLYDDSDFEDWSESNEKSMEEEKIKNNEVVEKSKSNTNVIEGIETEAVSEEERSYTPCLDENKIESEPGIGGMDTELVSEEEKNDFDESHEMKTASDGEALEINAKENELELTVRLDEYEEGEIIEGKKRATNKSPVTVTDDKKKETEKKKPKDDDKRKEKKKSENASFKKVSRSNKERNYRDRERSRSRDKKNKNDKKDGRQKKEKRKELERYDVRNVVGQKIAKKNFADVFGRNESRERSPSPVRVRSTSRSRRSRSLRSVSRERVSPARFRRSLSRRRRSGSRGRVSPLRKRPSPIRGGRRSLSRPRRSLSRTRRSLSRGKKSVSPAKDKRMRKSWSRSRSRSRGRIARKSRSRSPRLRKRRHRSKEKSRQKRKSEERGKSKKTRRRNRSSSPDKHRLSRSVSIPCRNQEQDDWQPGYVREWSPSWSRSPTPRMHRTMPNASPSWTPPVHHNGGNNIEPENLTVILTNNDAMKKKKDKRKKSDKRGKEITAGKKRKRGDRTPPPSKEVFASGDNILVSVSFNKTNEENDQQVSTREVVGTKRKRDNQSNDISKRSKKDKSVKDRNKKGDKKKSKKVKEASNMKPVAIIDLERSPFKEITPSPKDVIVLSDSDSGEKEAELMQRQGILQEELLEMGSQEEIDSVLQSPRENYINQSSGPKTPPEPQIKFHIQKPQQSLRNISNPLHEEQEDGAEGEEMDPQEELEMRLNEVMHKGPNTPPEPPASPPSSPDAYDPFEPTKSRSPSPEPTTQAPSSPVQKPPVDVVESDASLGDLAVCPLESSQKSNETQEPRSSSLERVMTIMASKRVGNSPEKSAHSPIPNTEQDSQIISSETSSAKDNNAISVVINQTIQPPPSSVFSAVVKPSVSVYSSVNPTMVTSTPIIQNVTAPRTSIFNTMPTSVPQRVVHPTPSKSTPVKPSPLKSAPVTKGPIKSTPIKPMPSKTIISKLPLPITKPYNQRNMPKNKNTSKNRGQNGNEIIDVDLDFDSPYSPGSSDYEDLFEPPVDNIKNTTPLKNTNQMKNTKSPAKVNPFDTLFGGGSPVYKNNNNKKQKVSSATKVPVKYNKKNVKGTKNQIGVKLDEDSLKILDDLPNSAVEMQVKDKFLKKLNRQERVVEEVKLVLKPHYNKKHVTKEQYKDILRRAVPKICHNKSGEINPKKIQCLIEAYVKKARAMNRKNSSGAVSNPTLVQPKTTKSAFWS